MNEIAGVPTVIPVLAVEDIQRAIAFYGQLGFVEVGSIPDQSGKPAHAHLRKGKSACFSVAWTCRTIKPISEPKPSGTVGRSTVESASR